MRPALVALVVVSAGCFGPDTGRVSPRAEFVGATPVLSSEDVIVGRTVFDEGMYLLTETRHLIRVEVASGTSRRMDIAGLAEGEPMRGLARSSDGTLWTIIGARTLAQISDTGHVLRRSESDLRYIMLSGWNGALIYQILSPTLPAPALYRRLPEVDMHHPFGTLQVVRSAGESRIEALAGGLALCGASRSDRLPCWFSHGTEIDFVQPDGRGRLVVLERLPPSRGVDLRESHGRPIVDVFVDPERVTWVLAGDVPSHAESGAPARLIRYGPEGNWLSEIHAVEPLRMLLDAEGTRAFALARSGFVVSLTVE